MLVGRCMRNELAILIPEARTVIFVLMGYFLFVLDFGFGELVWLQRQHGSVEGLLQTVVIFCMFGYFDREGQEIYWVGVRLLLYSFDRTNMQYFNLSVSRCSGLLSLTQD